MTDPTIPGSNFRLGQIFEDDPDGERQHREALREACKWAATRERTYDQPWWAANVRALLQYVDACESALRYDQVAHVEAVVTREEWAHEPRRVALRRHLRFRLLAAVIDAETVPTALPAERLSYHRFPSSFTMALPSSDTEIVLPDGVSIDDWEAGTGQRWELAAVRLEVFVRTPALVTV